MRWRSKLDSLDSPNDCLIMNLDRPNAEANLLTSKEVLEACGISRATLNNYISCGIVPRPEVLPPEPSDGAAPRIGYFPPKQLPASKRFSA